MKKYLIVAFLFGSAFFGYGQMVLSSGSQIIVNSGSVVIANDITGSGGTITNHGEVSVLGDITNNSGVLFNSSSSDGLVTFEGSEAQIITGTSSIELYGTIDIDNSNGLALTNATTGADQSIIGTLNFTNGLITLNGFNLTIGTTDPVGADDTHYIVTNSTGAVKREVGNSDVIFHVGNSTYNPVTLNNEGTSDTYGARVEDNYPSVFSGTTNIVDRSWVISEATPGESNLTVTTQWNDSDETTPFDETNSAIGLTTDNGATVAWGVTGAAIGTDPYTRTSSGITSTGTFMVGDSYYSGINIDLQVFLAGAYNTTNHNMDNNLNGLLTSPDPYGLSTSVSAFPTDAVDWVKIELRNKNDNTEVLYSFARLIDQSGQIIEEDGNDFKMTGVPMDSYYIAILHRNHFTVVSASTVNLASSPSLSFKGSQATAYQDGLVTTNAAMKEVETNIFALWDGDANGDGEVQYEGGNPDRISVLSAVGVSTPSNIISNTYSLNDVNMDGEVQYEGGNPDRITILSVIGVSTPSQIFYVHLP